MAVFRTKQDCERVGNDLCRYLNEIPLSSIQEGRHYYYDNNKGIMYTTPQGQDYIVLKADETNWNRYYEKLTDVDTTIYLLYSLTEKEALQA